MDNIIQVKKECFNEPYCEISNICKQLQAKEQECERLTSKCSQLKQTLTEIKVFFKEECLICKENYINITGEICEECKYQDILRKINEVE